MTIEDGWKMESDSLETLAAEALAKGFYYYAPGSSLDRYELKQE